MVDDESKRASEPKWLDSRQQEAWRALLRLMLRLPATLDSRLKEHGGLTLTEYNVLAFLSEAPDRSTRMATIAAEANLSASRLTHLASRLEQRGLIVRQPAGDDKRSIVAILTEAGSALVKRVAPFHVDDVRAEVFAKLSSSGTEQLLQVARAINGPAPRGLEAADRE